MGVTRVLGPVLKMLVKMLMLLPKAVATSDSNPMMFGGEIGLGSAL